MHPTTFEINEFVESSLEPAAAQTVRMHLDACDECRALVRDLRELRQVAATLEEKDPPPHLWPRIEAARQASRNATPGPTAAKALHVRRPLAWKWGLLAAAAVALLGIWTARSIDFTDRPGDDIAESASAQSIEAELALASEHYQKAIAGLEQVAASGESSLDPATAATLQKNLSVVDQAINESRAALKTQPDSAPAQQSLLDSFKAKVNLLQDTIGLINELRKGDEAGAARMVSGLKKGT